MAAMVPARAPQALMDEIVEEIILRLPPAEPASLLRAALVCKQWCRLISSPRFRRRFCEFHRAPPMLGFICNTRKGLGPYVARFVPTSSFRPPQADHRDWVALDARHGYVLLSTAPLRSVDSEIVYSEDRLLVVWNPTTDERWQLPPLVGSPFRWNWNATVLCAASGTSDHLDCLHATFLVVLVSFDILETTLRVYSSEACSWSQQTLAPLWDGVDEVPTALVGNTIYFSSGSGCRILSYDLATHETCLICLFPNFIKYNTSVMMMEDGVSGVGVAIAKGNNHSIPLLSMETSPSPSGDVGWAQIRVIELQKLLHGKALSMYHTPVGSAPGILFVTTDDGLFSINLKSDQVKKELDNDGNRVLHVVPYMCFYTPEIRASNR